MTSDHVAHCAQQVVRSAEKLQTAADELQAARGAEAKIHARIAPLDQARDAILDRRRQGDGRTDDVGALTINAADREDLTKLLPEAEAAVVAASAAHEQASAALVEAREAFDQTERQMHFSAVWEQVQEHVTKAALSVATAMQMAPRLTNRVGVADVGATLAAIEPTVLALIKIGALVSPGYTPTGFAPYVPSEAYRGALIRLEQHGGRFHQ